METPRKETALAILLRKKQKGGKPAIEGETVEGETNGPEGDTKRRGIGNKGDRERAAYSKAPSSAAKQRAAHEMETDPAAPPG